MARVTVTVDLTTLGRLADGVADKSPNGPLRKVFKQWAARYRSFVQERFDTYSKGGGDWPDLAESTKRRRKGGINARHSILRDTGLLYAALQPEFVGQPGAIEEDVEYGVKVGFGGPQAYPDGSVTVADVASFHQSGGPNLPQRKIIVDPPEEVLSSMADDMRRALRGLTG